MTEHREKYVAEMQKLQLMYSGAWAFVLCGCIAFILLPRGADVIAFGTVIVGLVLRGLVGRAVTVAFPETQKPSLKAVSALLAVCGVALLWWSSYSGSRPSLLLVVAVLVPAFLLFLLGERNVVRVLWS